MGRRTTALTNNVDLPNDPFLSQSIDSASMFPAIRDHGLGAASREKFKKQISFIKIHYNYEKFSRQSEDLTTRRMLV